MPKGFNNKAIEGFTQWMTAIVNETAISRAEADSLVRKTKTLLDEGFPKVKAMNAPEAAIMDPRINEINIKIGREYNRTALDGLLKFLEALYEDLLSEMGRGAEPTDAIRSELEEIRRLRKLWLS